MEECRDGVMEGWRMKGRRDGVMDGWRNWRDRGIEVRGKE